MPRRPLRGAASVVALAALGLVPGAAAGELTRFELVPSSQVRLEGTTNVHRWSCRSAEMDLSAHLDAPPEAVLAELERLEGRVAREGALRIGELGPGFGADFELAVPVRRLDCGNRRMEGDLRLALQAEESPEIRYRFEAVQDAYLAPSEHGGAPSLVLVVRGELALAGARREVVFPVEGRRLAPDRMRLTGRLPMRMTDFGIDPPHAVLGLVQARDRLTVTVDLLLELADGSPAGARPGPTLRVSRRAPP